MLLSVLLVVLSMLVMSCAGTPEVSDPSGLDISFRRLTAGDLVRYSVDKGLNPYYHDGLMLRPEETIVFRATVTTARPLGFELGRLYTYDENGVQVAEFFDRSRFLTFLERWTTDPSDYTRLVDEVKRSYIPYGELKLKPGKRDYILVLVGKRPLPKITSLRGLIFIDGSTVDVDYNL